MHVLFLHRNSVQVYEFAHADGAYRGGYTLQPKVNKI